MNEISKRANKKSLKVVYLSRGFIDVMSQMLEAMASFNEVYYICPKADEPILKWISGRVHVFKSGAPRVSSFRNLFYMFKVAKFIRNVNPDIIHIQSGLIWELLLVTILIRKPVVLTRHDVVQHVSDAPDRPIQKLAALKELEIASAVIVHSDYLVKMCYENFSAQVEGKLVRSVPLGIIGCFGKSDGEGIPPFTQLLFFGRIDKYKGLEGLAQAWGTVRSVLPGVRLVVAGAVESPDAENYYRSLFVQFPDVECRLARQSESEVAKLFTESTAIVLPYIEASQSAVLMLAHAFALPAVVSAVGGLADVAKDGFNCLTCAPGDVDQLAQALVRIVRDNELRATLKRNIIVEREQVFSWKEIVQSMDSIYREVLAECR